MYAAIGIKATWANNNYVCADLHRGSNAPLLVNRPALGLWEKFDIILLGELNFYDKIVALKSYATNRYVSAKKSDSYKLYADRYSISLYELFIMKKLGGNKIALKSYANNRYICADLHKNPVPFIANRDIIDIWETFEIVK